VAQITFMTGLMGAGIGALVGLASTSERWEPAAATLTHVSLAPHGMGLAVTIGF